MNKTLKRELDIVIHGQSLKFRIFKYLILIPITFLIYKNYGPKGLMWFLIIGGTLGITFHFLLRWLTKGWTKQWGPITLPKHS